jgi:hypothetical protein
MLARDDNPELFWVGMLSEALWTVVQRERLSSYLEYDEHQVARKGKNDEYGWSYARKKLAIVGHRIHHYAIFSDSLCTNKLNSDANPLNGGK